MRDADVVIIGSGGFGAATAYFLARRGRRRVAVVDRFDLGSQSSRRAAGLAAQVRPTDQMTRLARRAVELLVGFTRETGQPLDIVQPGSLKAARTTVDLRTLEDEATRGARLGLGTTILSAQEAQRLHPFFQPQDVVGLLHTPGDIYFESAQLALGYARAAEQLGVTLIPRTTVTGVRVEQGQVRAVETDTGTIAAPVVVDAAGAWARQVAAQGGAFLPLVPTRHQLYVTEPIEGVRPDLPILRIMDAGVYVRPCSGGLLFGGAETDPTQLDMGQMPGDFSVSDVALDLGLLRRLTDRVMRQLPVLQTATVREHRGGIVTVTPDGLPVVGPVPGVEGFFIAGGCNLAGLSISPAIGEQLAHWIADGRPTEDLGPLSLGRFGPEWRDEPWLREAAAWQF